MEHSLPWQRRENKVAICTRRVPPEGPFLRRTHITHSSTSLAFLGDAGPSEQGLPSLAADKRPFLSYTENVLLCQRVGLGLPGPILAQHSAGGGGLSVTRSPA